MKVYFKEIESKFKPDNNGNCSVSDDGMIATQSSHATQIGKEMLKKNGNAVDAAVASALALGVSEPQASGLGGQTMLLIGNGKQRVAIDGSSRAPSLAHASSIYKDDRALGYRATTVPSTPATLWYIQKNYGQLKWEQILHPVAELAEQGYLITALQQKLLEREHKNFEKVQSQSGIKYFFNNSEPYKVGELFKQPELAALLKKLAEKGIHEFYRGNTAKQIDADMRENGGVLRYDDLALIPYPIEREPLTTCFRGLDVYTMPPPGAGRTLLYTLKMIEFIEKDYRIKSDNELFHLIISIIRKAFLERADRPFDPNFFAQISDDAKMLDDKFAYESIKEIIEDVNKKLLPIIPTEDEMSGETTHLSVIDKSGMAVALTQSIERVYGSKAVADGLGFIYNNYMDDFDYNRPEHPYYIRPNANPWATVAPTLIYNDENIWMSLGSPGSERIVSNILLFLLRVIDRNYSIDEAMKAPRLHCSLGGRVSIEAGRFAPSVIDYLKKQGYRIDQREDYSFYLGCLQAVVKKQSGQGFQGIADIRRDGSAK
ncbi:gamma-glutamyltransferase family protein [candidate division CSSED10-310 bacterium]|uniref:Gamma-glutamyltransferase family protein n=1 Tax=candidate division CSSED10-310 bacterium TaxID=2855610 RepID=A0ABV6YXB5_UNCC1